MIDDDQGIAFALGAGFGSVLVLLAIFGVVARFTSTTGGLVALVVAGCLLTFVAVLGTARQSETDRELREAIEELGLDPDADDVELTDAEIDCLEASGFDPDDLLTALTDTGAQGADLQRQYLDVVSRCAPQVLLTDDAIEQFRASFSSGWSGEITTDEARCLLERVTAAPVPSDLLAGADADAFGEMLTGCLSEESLASLLGAPGTGAQAIGDDPRLDRLAELCRSGADAACDLLYDAASIGSEYSTIGQTCADRGVDPETLWCTRGFVDRDGDGFLDVDSVGWPGMLEACRDGDMIACDFAFALSPIGSEPERVGETCGERHAVAAAESCVERYGVTADDE